MIHFNRKIEWNKQTSCTEYYVCLQVKTNRQKLNCEMKCIGARSPFRARNEERLFVLAENFYRVASRYHAHPARKSEVFPP